MRRIVLVAAGVALAVALFAVLRPSDEADGDAVETTTAASTRTAPTAAPPPPAPQARATPVVRIAIRDADVLGGLRHIRVRRGETVVLVVTSDVADRVHVHGLDVSKPVGLGTTARFRLTPKVAGRYEVELEDRHFPIAQLEVQP